jgi:hypothetical protein
MVLITLLFQPTKKYGGPHLYYNEDNISEAQFIDNHRIILCMGRKIVLFNLDTLEAEKILEGSLPKRNYLVGVTSDCTGI